MGNEITDIVALAPGDVVQIDPEHDERFGGCFMQITEPKSWGAQGFVRVPGGGNAYYRVPANAMTRIGRAEWVIPEPQDDGK